MLTGVYACVCLLLSPYVVSLLKEDGCHRVCRPLARVYRPDSLFIIRNSLFASSFAE